MWQGIPVKPMAIHPCVNTLLTKRKIAGTILASPAHSSIYSLHSNILEIVLRLFLKTKAAWPKEPRRGNLPYSQASGLVIRQGIPHA